jgi:hypothetical protein
MKVCTKCNVKKEFIEFYKDKNKKDGYNSCCKFCRKQYDLENPEKKIQYRLENLDKSKEYHKQYWLENKEKLKIYKRDYYLENKKEINSKSYKYNLNNKLNRNKREKEKRKENTLYRLIGDIRSLIGISIRNKNYNKKSKTYEILGCSYEEFKIHLESQFTEGMTWENKGQWHMDHIYPVSRATDEDHLIRLNHYTNFQPMWAVDNIKKSNKI